MGGRTLPRSQFVMPSNANRWRGIFSARRLICGATSHQVFTDLAGGQGAFPHTELLTCVPPPLPIINGGRGAPRDAPAGIKGVCTASSHDGGVQEAAERSPVAFLYSSHIHPTIATLRFLRFFSLLLFKIRIRQNSS